MAKLDIINVAAARVMLQHAATLLSFVDQTDDYLSNEADKLLSDNFDSVVTAVQWVESAYKNMALK